MGASFVCFKLKGTTTEVRAEFEEAQDDDRYRNGHEYSGGVGMCSGLAFPNKAPFSDEQLAEQWLLDNAKKWEEALAVPLMPASDNVWLIGAWCAS